MFISTISTCASGTLSVKYGTMRENVRSMVVVLADGREMSTRTRAVKTAAGYRCVYKLSKKGLFI